MAAVRQRRSASTASATGNVRKQESITPTKSGHAPDPLAPSSPPAEFLASTYSLFEVNSLVAYAITLTVCLVAQTLFTIVTTQLPRMEYVADISRNMSSTGEFAALLAWKVTEVSIGWLAGFNALEMGLFTFITGFPHFYFLWTFYLVDWVPLTVTLALNTIANIIGFSYSRLVESDVTSLTGVGQDLVLWTSTRLLSAALYAVPMLLSLNTWLPVHLATYWSDLETLAPARSATILGLAPAFFLLGHSTVGLILNPVVQHRIQVQGAAPTSEFDEFDPASATLKETVEYNMDSLMLWKHIKPSVWFLVKRTTVVAFWITANAAFGACATIEGCDTASSSWLAGPTFWGSVWGAGAVASGAGLGWVGGIL